MRKTFVRHLATAAGLLCVGVASGQDIISLQNGNLTFTNANPALYYRVEFKPSLTGSNGCRHAPISHVSIDTDDFAISIMIH